MKDLFCWIRWVGLIGILVGCQEALTQEAMAQAAGLASGSVYGGRIDIVAPAAATSSILKPAIADLQKYLQQMSGTGFRIGQGTKGPGIRLVLTISPHAPADSASRLAGRSIEAFIIRSGGAQLEIAANDERGLAHGIYYYLEELGVRWLLSGVNWTIVPARRNITVSIDKLVEPAFWLGPDVLHCKPVRSHAPEGVPGRVGFPPGLCRHIDPPTFPLEPNMSAQVEPYAFREGSKTISLTSEELIDLSGSKVKDMTVYSYWSIPDWAQEEPSTTPQTFSLEPEALMVSNDALQ